MNKVLVHTDDRPDMLELAERYLPDLELETKELKKGVPALARDPDRITAVETAVKQVATRHSLIQGDARSLECIDDESVHLVVTSPPYWTLKEYHESDAQLGFVEDYEEFIGELERVWKECFRVVAPGGRVIIVVGDVCLSRRKHGRHAVVPLHAGIQESCRRIGFDNLAPIIWYKIANASFEAKGGSGGFLGKPYEPNAVIKNDIEYILMQRKPGGYRSPTPEMRALSVIGEREHREWFRQIWTIPGASTRDHPAPYPLELAVRLIRMFSFAGDTVLDPFMGTGTTNVAAAKWGRNSIGNEIDSDYFSFAISRLEAERGDLFSRVEIDHLVKTERVREAATAHV